MGYAEINRYETPEEAKAFIEGIEEGRKHPPHPDNELVIFKEEDGMFSVNIE